MTSRTEIGFNLSTFLASFDPDLSGAERDIVDEARPVLEAPSALDVLTELQALRDEVTRLRGLMTGSGLTWLHVQIWLHVLTSQPRTRRASCPSGGAVHDERQLPGGLE